MFTLCGCRPAWVREQRYLHCADANLLWLEDRDVNTVDVDLLELEDSSVT